MTQISTTTQLQEDTKNPGYSYLLDIYWMRDAQAVASPEKTRYYLPAKALLNACSAIDGYINVVGNMVDPQWKEIDEETAPIKTRLFRIFRCLGLPLELKQDLWENVLLLFILSEKINQHKLTDVYDAKEENVPNVFKLVAQNYPIRVTHAIAEEAIEFLLSVSA